jgi:hypothetical protein
LAAAVEARQRKAMVSTEVDEYAEGGLDLSGQSSRWSDQKSFFVRCQALDRLRGYMIAHKTFDGGAYGLRCYRDVCASPPYHCIGSRVRVGAKVHDNPSRQVYSFNHNMQTRERCGALSSIESK